MKQQIDSILAQLGRVIAGKEQVIRGVVRTVLADGHVLLDDVPGVGKTTLALALSRAVGLTWRRVQFTPDVTPSDIVGYSMYDRESGKLVYVPGAVNDADLLLADELNRTSSRTQSALLEAMEERQVTVDGTTRPLSAPFLVIATQNNVGTAGTQPLPYAQLDRFMARLTVGQPDQSALMQLLRDRQGADPMAQVACVCTREELLGMQAEVRTVRSADAILDYIARLVVATREHPALEAGISPRGALMLDRAAKAEAYMAGRDYVTGGDVQAVAGDVCTHRLILSRRAGGTTAGQVLREIVAAVDVPDRRA